MKISNFKLPTAHRLLLSTMKRTITMKRNLASASLVLCFMVLFSTNIKAQDDANCGIYIDGTIVDKIDCWTFDYMYLIFPIPPLEKYSNYDLITVSYVKTYLTNTYTKEYGNTVFSMRFTPQGFKDNFGNAKYGVYKFLMNKETRRLSDDQTETGTPWTRKQYAGKEKYFYKDDESFEVQVAGFTISAYQYDNNGGKYPVYGNGVFLYKSDKIPHVQCKKCKWDENVPCTVTGKKVELKIEKSLAYNDNLGIIKGSGGNSNSKSNTNIEEKTTTTKTTVTKTTSTTKTTPISNSTIKPLDKTKPGYFAEKDGDVIKYEGYKKGGKLNGEVRIYDDGKLTEICMYVNDEKNGLSTRYYENGKISAQGNMKNNQQDGEWKYFDSDGKNPETKKYINGEAQD